MNFSTSIQYLKGVGERRAAVLKKLGIRTAGELLWHVPRTYEDWSSIQTIEQAPVGEPCCIRAFVEYAPEERLLRGGMTLFKTQVTDGSGVLGITIFNSGYLAQKLKEGEEYLFFGRIAENFLRREMLSPQIDSPAAARLRPVYPLTEGITSRQIEGLVACAMEQLLPQLPEVLPEAQRTALQLLPRRAALRAVHQPKDLAEAAAARRRLIFEELFFMQLGLLRLRQSVREKSAPALCGGTGLDFFASLPFAPTKAQLRAAEEGLRDLAKPVPMRRLLQGDVGSGKTAVAAALLEQAAQSGWQAALMAPTELLARQHCETLAKLFARRSLAPVLLTGSIPAAQKRKIKAGLRTGSIPLVVGTHALLQKDVAFARLGLAVVDEQHRFGVEQRSLLEEAGAGQPSPHVLVMSATPIPRSLALFVFGDLDISVLDELPPGRTPVETYAVTSALRARAYRYVAKHLEQGRQGYVVCPRVEDEGESELTAATQFAAQLQADWLRGYSVGLLHGRCKPKQKEEVMRAFAAGEIQLLVSTTVIEVGVDVPNAVIMVIENAERFGLSQLHQLRGRVGRGGGRATCILISDAENEEARRRLELMKETNDGFVIAREDLRLRGPGDFFGRRQHGLPQFKLADLLEDSALLPAAKEAALAVFQEDPSLAAPEHRQLRAEVERMMEA